MENITESELAELIFGRQLRFDVARWILFHGSPRFYQLEAARALPDRFNSAVPRELDRLVRAGLLEKEQQVDGERRQYYVRTDSMLWDIFKISDKVFRERTGTER